MRFVALALLLAACGNETKSEPPVTSAGGAPAENPLPTVKRTVVRRNPFGNTVVSDNLMADGDFEMTGRQGQMPWNSFVNNQGQAVLDYETGGKCLSGIRCAVIPAGSTIWGYMASPEKDKIWVTLHVKPDSGHCSDVSAFVYDTSQNVNESNLLVVTADVDETGWCTMQAETYNYATFQPILYVTVKDGAASTSILIDDVVALPSSKAGNKPKLAAAPPDNRDLLNAHFIADWLKRHRDFGRPRTQDDPLPPRGIQ